MLPHVGSQAAKVGSTRFDALIVGGGHNGLVAAALLAGAGRSVAVLERLAHVGGAAISAAPFPGLDARLSRYSYLVSLFPAGLARALGLRMNLRRRRFDSYTPHGDGGLLVGPDRGRTRDSMTDLTGDPEAFVAWERFHAMLGCLAERIFPTLTEPLRSRQAMRRLLDDDLAWNAIFEQPLDAMLSRCFRSDLLRGLVATDAAIGTFAPADDPLLRQNRCFLYHVIGNGTGRWELPVGGMGALSSQLAGAAQRAGARVFTGAEVIGLATDGSSAEATCSDGRRFQARYVLANVAPRVLAGLFGERCEEPGPEGSQLKVNMLLSRLPRLRDRHVEVSEAFAGTFHVNEGYGQLQRAYDQAASGRLPSLPPCELYCHSLADQSILGPELRDAGAHALTLFGLHMPRRLFSSDPERQKRLALHATLRSLDSVLAEPVEDCLVRKAEGDLCIEALSPLDVERELAMPGGHIFHRDLAWPFAESEEEEGSWGVAAAWPNVWLCGAGARRGGGVSGIPGHNAARAVLAAAHANG